MITPEYCRTMARYNAWQNAQLAGFLADLPEAELTADRKGFFGSLLGTVNHLLWGDTIWMSRFDGGPLPACGIPDSPKLCASLADWAAARREMDARIIRWADGLGQAALDADLTWFSGAAGREVSKPLALCVTHMFNHQTHHRGQAHAMLTAAGSEAPVSDLFLMPEEVAVGE